MTFQQFLGLVCLVPLVVFAFDVWRFRKPLTHEEMEDLVGVRRFKLAMERYRFDLHRVPVSSADKAAMHPGGEFREWNEEFVSVPNKVAGLLKFKKHEWIVYLFIKDLRVVRVWWNKGNSSFSVKSTLDHGEMLRTISKMKIDTLAVLHNHPNPDPKNLDLTEPSKKDIESALELGEVLDHFNISLIEFVCERGLVYPFFASFAKGVVPREPLLAEVKRINGTSIWSNRALRKELIATPRGYFDTKRARLFRHGGKYYALDHDRVEV